jgi:hypothetical protein
MDESPLGLLQLGVPALVAEFGVALLVDALLAELVLLLPPLAAVAVLAPPKVAPQQVLPQALVLVDHHTPVPAHLQCGR